MQDWTGGQNSVYKTIGASNHTNEAREADDYYATDPRAINKLLTVTELNIKIWEPACGGGHLSERLTELGYYVYSSDKVDRGYKRHTRTRDFLNAVDSPFNGNFDIITNPPYLQSIRWRNMYACKMTDDMHAELLKLIIKSKSKVIISAYDNGLYNEYLKGWYTAEKNTIAQAGKHRTEKIYMNYAPDLFSLSGD